MVQKCNCFGVWTVGSCEASRFKTVQASSDSNCPQETCFEPLAGHLAALVPAVSVPVPYSMWPRVYAAKCIQKTSTIKNQKPFADQQGKLAEGLARLSEAKH